MKFNGGTTAIPGLKLPPPNNGIPWTSGFSCAESLNIKEFCLPLTIDEDALSENKLATSLLVDGVDLSAFLAVVDVGSDEVAFPGNKWYKSLVEYVVDVSYVPAIADGYIRWWRLYW